jgi:glycine cleavage system H lipoate-binding protein/TusA-related sulfurtransferase
MEIDSCIFPDQLLYDVENLVWASEDHSDESVLVGITTIMAFIAGKIFNIRIKSPGTEIKRGKSVGTVESNKYFGVVRSPISGKIIDTNHSIINNPKIVNDYPYTKGWFVRIRPSNNIYDEYKALETIENCHVKIRPIIQQLHIRCFAAFPDHELYEIGVECAATLTKLDELLARIEIGQVVHLVSDDVTADLEITRWSEQTGQSVIELRREGNLFHFIIKKIK